jgi:TatD DNase family protein
VITFIVSGSLFRSVLKEDKVWGAVGCHPKHAVLYNDCVEQKLRAMLKHEKIVALGEIGLDYSGR